MRYFIYCRKSSEAEDRQIASIESQLTTLQRQFGGIPDIEIIDVYEEAFSAKAPGRPKFNEMMQRIDRREANGIIVWAPDRLARNSIDGGRIVYMLDTGALRDLKFATYTFENNSQGKFMLQIMFGQSKYYSDALSDNVKRGNLTKLQHGWRPNNAPFGYINDKTTKTIVPDPIYFPIVRQIFQRMLTGAYSPRELAIAARDQWGLVTPKKKRSGGTPLAMSSMYKILNNPFYAGLIVWNGETYPGKHKPMITAEEFRAIRNLLRKSPRLKPKRHHFAYRGVIRCASCGMVATAEHKVNRYGYHYVYYHCSKRKLGPRCQERSITEEALQEQIVQFLNRLAIDRRIEEFFIQELRLEIERDRADAEASAISLNTKLEAIQTERMELTGLRLRGHLTDEEFLFERQKLDAEQKRLHRMSEQTDTLEPFSSVISFSNNAAKWFLAGDDFAKRTILQISSSNLRLKNKKISIQAKEPFVEVATLSNSPSQLAVVEDVEHFETLRDKVRHSLAVYRAWTPTKEGQDTLLLMKQLRRHIEPEVVLAEERNKKRTSASARHGRAQGGISMP